MRARDEAIRAVNDVECGQTYLPAKQGLHVIFEGQLRGMDRFGIKKPPVWYRSGKWYESQVEWVLRQ